MKKKNKVLYEKFLRHDKYETVVYPHIFQQKTLTTEAMFIVFLGGKYSGKTSWGPVWLLNKFDQHPGEDGMIVAPTYDMLKQVALVSFVNFVKNTAYEGVGMEKGVRLGLHTHDNVYLTPFNKIFLGTAQEPKHLEGKHVCGIWADELGQFNYEAGKVLKTRIDKGGGQLLGTTTPYNEGWLYLDWYKKYLSNFRNPLTNKLVYDFIQLNSLANPNFPRELWEQNKKEMSEEEFGMFYEGKFTHLTGLVYPMPQMRKLPYNREDQLFGCIDWGYTDKMAFAIMGHKVQKEKEIKKDEWKLYRTIAEAELDLIEFSDMIVPYIKESGISRLFYDWHEATDPFTLQRILQERHRLYINFIPAPVQKISEGVRIVRGLIKNGNLIIDEDRTIEAQDEFNTYKKKPDGSPEEKKNNDVMDCIRYGITGEMEFEKGFPDEPVEVIQLGLLDNRIDNLINYTQKGWYD